MRLKTKGDYLRDADNMAGLLGMRIHLRKNMENEVLSYDCKTTYFVDKDIIQVFNFLKEKCKERK